MSKTEVDLGNQTILAAIPIAQIYAFYKIKKIKKGMVLLTILYSIFILPLPFYAVEFLTDYVGLNNPLKEAYYGISMTRGAIAGTSLLFVYLLVDIIISIYFVRIWTRQYNSKLATDG